MTALISRDEAAAEAAAAPPLTPEQEVEARLWVALQDVEDPEIPISVVGMGLIVSIAFKDGEVDHAARERDRDDQAHADDRDRDLGVLDVLQGDPQPRLDLLLGRQRPGASGLGSRLFTGDQRAHERYPRCSVFT